MKNIKNNNIIQQFPAELLSSFHDKKKEIILSNEIIDWLIIQKKARLLWQKNDYHFFDKLMLSLKKILDRTEIKILLTYMETNNYHETARIIKIKGNKKGTHKYKNNYTHRGIMKKMDKIRKKIIQKVPKISILDGKFKNG